ncbi:hypothetical protein RV11_GL000412 [Enterococcus phoeniculicola]|jgi:hypothetical protein|uniref:Uncharacterized protein n=2 Tax=Enterococcus phoeniculicola TaxID=154621 RepID=R3U2K9_9ENTE|nr:hypothetical protein UC3_00611 [Enterococcus phoeniculicola ATCC BAA-412]EOT72903.1 hypothetical protein I589_03174 [Enterococcus phoeniculicola ATCC BAA-412]OJG71397.1 hypothetical protein RV11_GL000412 [Enterococcus phoeniculicola]
MDEYMNFVLTENPKIKEGDSLIVKIVKVTNVMGSCMLTLKKGKVKNTHRIFDACFLFKSLCIKHFG